LSRGCPRRFGVILMVNMGRAFLARRRRAARRPRLPLQCGQPDDRHSDGLTGQGRSRVCRTRASRFLTLRASAESHETSSYFFIGFKSVYLRAYARMASANNSERGRRSLADSSRRSRSALVECSLRAGLGIVTVPLVGLALLWGSSSWSKYIS